MQVDWSETYDNGFDCLVFNKMDSKLSSRLVFFLCFQPFCKELQQSPEENSKSFNDVILKFENSQLCLCSFVRSDFRSWCCSTFWRQESPKDPNDRKYLTKMTMAITLKGSVITEAILHGYKALPVITFETVGKIDQFPDIQCVYLYHCNVDYMCYMNILCLCFYIYMFICLDVYMFRCLYV